MNNLNKTVDNNLEVENKLSEQEVNVKTETQNKEVNLDIAIKEALDKFDEEMAEIDAILGYNEDIINAMLAA